MSRPKFPMGLVMTSGMIDRINQEQCAYDRDPEGYERREKEWSFDECYNRGCLPSGEPLEAAFGQGWWSEENQ